jgi:hypothetical protein
VSPPERLRGLWEKRGLAAVGWHARPISPPASELLRRIWSAPRCHPGCIVSFDTNFSRRWLPGFPRLYGRRSAGSPGKLIIKSVAPQSERTALRRQPRGVKQMGYDELVLARNSCHRCEELLNPADATHAQFDGPEVGPWSRWLASRPAKLILVGQDWGTDGYFRDHRGRDIVGNPANTRSSNFCHCWALQSGRQPNPTFDLACSRPTRSFA